MLRRLLSVAALLLAAAPAHLARANISYVESADLPNSVSGAINVGTVGAGLNTVQGSLNAVRTGNALLPLGGDSFDSFAFTVPPGMVVTRVRVDVMNWNAVSGSGGAFAATADAGNSTGEAQYQTTSGNTTFTNIITAADGVIGPGTYTLWTHAGDNLSGPQRQLGDSLNFTYVFSITVVPLAEYVEGASGGDVSALGLPLGTLASPVGGASDGAAVHVGGSISVTGIGGGMIAPAWRGDADAFSFTIPPGTAGARVALTVGGFAVAGNYSTPPMGAIQLSNATTGESYLRTFGANGVITDALPASVGGAMTAGMWTVTMASAAPSPIASGQTLNYTYSLRLVTTVDSGACCNRWTGSCVVTPAAMCGGLGLRFDAFGSTCGAGVCRACPADFDGSGTLAVADIFAMLNAWFAGCP